MSARPKSNSATVLADLTEKLRACLHVESKNIYAIGKLLTDARKIVEHGEWLPWLEGFGINERTARRYLLAHKFKLAIMRMPAFKSDRLSELKLRPTIIYKLAEVLEVVGGEDNEVKAGYPLEDGCVVAVNIEDVEAVLMAAKTEWVGPTRIEAILRERHPEFFKSDTVSDLNDADADADADAGSDGEGSEPPTPRTRRPSNGAEHAPPEQGVAMTSFASWVEGLWGMRDTDPHSLRNVPIKREQVEEAIRFLQGVVDAMSMNGRLSEEGHTAHLAQMAAIAAKSAAEGSVT
jgi:hypothetical protein